MTTATARPEPTPVHTFIDDHKEKMAALRAEQNANREELLKCCNPAYAAQKETAKPVYHWTVRAEWLGHDRGGEGIARMQAEQNVVAQNENDAWAAFCDKIGTWPSRRDARPIIKRGKQLSFESVVAARITGVEADAIIPTVVVGPISKKSKL